VLQPESSIRYLAAFLDRKDPIPYGMSTRKGLLITRRFSKASKRYGIILISTGRGSFGENGKLQSAKFTTLDSAYEVTSDDREGRLKWVPLRKI